MTCARRYPCLCCEDAGLSTGCGALEFLNGQKDDRERIAQAERRGAVKALRRVTEHDWAYSQRAIREYADDLEKGVESL